jgi:hypothetical protein
MEKLFNKVSKLEYGHVVILGAIGLLTTAAFEDKIPFLSSILAPDAYNSLIKNVGWIILALFIIDVWTFESKLR